MATLPPTIESHDRNPLLILLRGSGIVMLGMGLRIVLLFTTEVIAARILMPERYGLITWGLFLLNILSMLTGLGLKTAVQRFLPIYQSQNDLRAIRGTVLLTGIMSFGGGIGGSLLLLAGASWLAAQVMGDARETIILLIFAFALPVWNLQRVMVAVFGGFKRPLQKVLVEDLLVPIGFLLVVLSAWAMDKKEVYIAEGYVLVYLVSALLSVIFVYSKTPYGETRHVKPKYHVREILGFSWPLIFTEPFGKSTGLIDVLVVGTLAASYNVGLYRTASDMAATMTVILMVFGFMYLPLVSGFVANDNYTQWSDMNARIARWSMLVSFPVFATLFFFPGEVIRTIYGPEYMTAAPVLRILAVAYFGHTMVGFTGINLVAAGMTRVQLLAHFASFALNIGGNFVLIPLYGIQGAAVATLLSLWTKNVILLVVMQRRLGFHPFTRLYLHNLGRLFLIASGAAFLLRLSNFLPDIVLLGLFLLIWLGFIGLLYYQDRLLDAADSNLIRSLGKSLPPKLRGKERAL